MKVSQHVSELDQLLIKEKEFLSCYQVFSLGENSNEQVVLQFIISCSVDARDERDYESSYERQMAELS